MFSTILTFNITSNQFEFDLSMIINISLVLNGKSAICWSIRIYLTFVSLYFNMTYNAIKCVKRTNMCSDLTHSYFNNIRYKPTTHITLKIYPLSLIGSLTIMIDKKA